MKKSLLFLVLALAFMQSALSAQTVTLNQGGYSGASFTVTMPDLHSATRKIGDGQYLVLTYEGSTHLFRDGEPDIPVISQIIEVPLCSDIEVSVSNVKTATKALSSVLNGLPNLPLLPMQPAPSKSDIGPRPFVMDSAIYATNAYYSAPEVAWVDVVGVARDRRLAALRVSPVSYNPVTGMIEYITSMTVTLTYKGVDEPATRELRNRYYSPAFSLGNNVLATLPAQKSVRDAAPLHYLIVAHSSFRGQLDDFIAWKRRRGMIVTVGYTDDPAVGTTTTSIANYIRGFYTNATDELPAPTYLLIVGDNEQVPAFDARCTSPASDHVTDLYYVTWDNDNVPDCYRGRFSAQNSSQLKAQVDKTLLYEGYNFADPSYLSRGALIAGVDGGYSGDNAYNYADPTMDYIAKTYVNDGNGFTTVKYYKNNTAFAPTGVTVTGSSQSSSTSSTLRTLYNSGYGWVNYSAHGSETSWADPEFNTNHAAQMSNYGKPGVFIGNCCLSGKFDVSNCFGESLLRRGDNAGAVAYIGATNSTYWPHDFCWTVGLRSAISGTMNASYDATRLGMYDRLFHTHNEDYTLWHNTLGSMVTAGNMAVVAYGSYELYYWEIYQLFGDPSLIPWLGHPGDMPFDGSSSVVMGSSDYVFTTAPRAYVALTSDDDHTLLSAAYADAVTGEVSLPLPDDIAPGTYELAVWAQGFKPLFTEITFLVPSGPYLSALNASPRNGFVLPGQANTFDLTVVNNGVSPAWNATLNVEAMSDGVVSLHPTLTLPTVHNGDTLLIPSAFSLFVPASYGSGDLLSAQVQMRFADRTSTRTLTFKTSAPKLVVSQTVADGIDRGSSATVSCVITNDGDLPTGDLTLTLVNPFGLVNQSPQPIHVGILLPCQSASLSFTMTMSNNLPDSQIPFDLMADDGQVTFLVDRLIFPGPGSAMEDFETGDFSRYSWVQGNNAWIVTTADKHSGLFSARSKNNLSNRRSSDLTISWTSVFDDSVAFWYKVSSEEDYDIFSFYIDGAVKLEASGTNVTTWRRAAFPVSAGTHTFKFSYAKDWYSTAGSDCAWIDDITLPYAGTLTRFVYDTVCQGSDYSFAGAEVNTERLGDFVYVDSTTSADEIVYLALNVADAPEVTVTTSGTMLLGGRAVLTAHGASSYSWNTGDTTASIVVSPTEATTYTVTGYRGGCSAEVTVEIGVGVTPQPSTLNSQVSVYPNPTQGVLNVVCPDLRSVTLVNAMGQVVYRAPASAQCAQFSIQNCPDGVYFLKVETPEGVAVKKILKR